MAEQGKRIDEGDQRRIRRMAEASRPKTEIARMVGVSRPTAYKYAVKSLRIDLEPFTVFGNAKDIEAIREAEDAVP